MTERTASDRSAPPRLPRLAPDELTPEQTGLYHQIVEGPRQQHASFFPVADEEGILSGPYRAMLLSPDIGAALERVGVAVRYRSSLPGWARELAILTVACHCESDVEWRAHEELARASGLPDATIETLASRSPTLADRPAEVTYAFVTELLAHHVTDDTFAAATRLWATTGVFELVATVGYYQIIAGINNAFGLDA